MRYLTFILALICSSVLTVFDSCAQKSADKSDVSSIDKNSNAIVQNFFNGMKKGEYRSAISSLLDQNEFINKTDSSTTYLLNKFYFINEVSGPFLGHQLIKSKKIENDVAVYSYLAKYEKKFYRFLFVFYNNGNKLALYEFSFDDSISEEIKESIKLYFN